MHPRVTCLVSLLGLLTLVVLVPAPVATGQDAAVEDGTEDILYFEDGSELHGQILKETDEEIEFESVDQRLRIRLKRWFAKDLVARIERDVPVRDAPAPEEPTRTRPRKSSTTQPDRTVYRVGMGESSNEALPAFYVIPMKGQMGTDIHIDIYRDVAEDIRAQKPDLVIWKLDCADVDELMLSMSDATETGKVDLEQYRDLVNILKDEIPGIRQVMWVQDSFGISSVIALAWEDMYMHPDARLYGLRQIWQHAAGWADDDVRAKMIAAWVGIANGFLENGGYPIELGRAMMNPKYSLSATWRGREVIWTLNQAGEYVVDQSEKATAGFRAKSAEDFCISDGTAENLDDLAMLLGYREYRIIDGQADEMVEEYVHDWRQAFDNTKTWWDDANIALNRGGDNPVAQIGKAKSLIGKIIRAMEKYKAVELRWASDIGPSKFDLITMEEQLREQLRALRQQGRNRGGGGGGGVGGGG